MEYKLDSIDCIIVFSLLIIFFGICIYFGLRSKKLITIDDYLLGNQNINSIAIAVSLITGQITVFSILNTPVEVYRHGLHIIWSDFALFLVLPIIILIIIPIFYDNYIWNCFEYLEKRFNRDTRNLVTVAYVIKVYALLPTFIYIPSLFFSELTQINIHVINGIVCSICVFYTMLGGVKAVIWSQIFQGFVIFVSIMTICIICCIKYGFAEILKTADIGKRTYATNFTIDFKSHATFWNTLIGGCFTWISFFGVQPITIQRCSSVSNAKDFRRSIKLFAIGITIFSLMLHFIGFTLYAKFLNCDPQQLGLTDDLMKYFVQHDLSNSFNGFRGLFIASLFCAAISSMTTNLNSVAGILYSHYFIEIDSIHPQIQSNLIMKKIIIATGIWSFLGGFLIEQYNWIIEVTMKISTVSQCFLAGIFLIGIVYPKSIGPAVFRATYFSLLLSVIFQNVLEDPTVPAQYNDLTASSIKNCSEYNLTGLEMAQESPIYVSGKISSLSPYWYSMIGSGIVWILAVPWSKLMSYKQNHKKICLKLMSPLVINYDESREQIQDNDYELTELEDRQNDL